MTNIKAYCLKTITASFLAVFAGFSAGAAAATVWEHTPRPRVPPGTPQSGNLEILVIEEDNDAVSSFAHFFVFDSPDHPLIAELRERYNLDAVVEGAETDLERAVKLKSWVARALKFGTPESNVFGDWSALALLEIAERGEEIWCGQAATVFQQACIALGMHARFIEIGIPENPASHFTTEVYLREYGKWAVIDPTPLPAFELYYTVDGVPQSALEMHRRVVRRDMDDVTIMRPGGSSPVTGDSPAWTFYYLRWLLRNDVVSRTPEFVDMEHVFDRRLHSVEWVDEHTTPWEDQKPGFWKRNERLAAWNTSNPAVVEWNPTERVQIDVQAADTDERRDHPYEVAVNVQLWEKCLNFERFQIKVDEEEWRDLPTTNIPRAVWSRDFNHGPNFFKTRRSWNPWQADTQHSIRARILRRDGSVGPESFVNYKLGWGNE